MKRFLVLCSLFLCLPIAVRAASPVAIGEIAWAGSNASTADEWLELCGSPGTDLSGWAIEGAGTGGAALILPAGSLMPARGAFLISNYADDDAKSTLSAAPDWTTTAVALSNSALFLTLRDAAGSIVDTAGQPGAAPFAGTSGSIKASMERLFPLADGGTPAAWASASDSQGFDAGATERGTPGACPTVQDEAPPSLVPEDAPADDVATSTEPVAPPEQAATSTAVSPPPSAASSPNSPVRISEAYPWPNAGEHEWIELIDPSDVGELLDGWTLEDGKGTATALSGLLLPWSRVVIDAPKGQLNNDGDLIALKDASGRLIDAVAYGGWSSSSPNAGEVRRGESLIRLEMQDAFAVTTTPTPGNPNVLTVRIPLSSTPAEAGAQNMKKTDPSTALRSAQDDKEAAVVARVAEKEAPEASATPVIKMTPKKPTTKKPPTSKYKGRAYTAIVASPPGLYSKTRLFALIGDALREVRLSKTPGAEYAAGARIAFVAQEKTEGADAYLLANPNSIRRLEASASATFATVEAWPEAAGPYRFEAEVVSMQAGALATKLGGVEGDVLAPTALTASLKAGDIVSVEGYVAPGPRPRAVLSRPEALTLFKAFQAAAPPKAPPAKLPWQAAVGLTLATALIGAYVYLRHQRLQRLALALTPIDADDETW